VQQYTTSLYYRSRNFQPTSIFLRPPVHSLVLSAPASYQTNALTKLHEFPRKSSAGARLRKYRHAAILQAISASASTVTVRGHCLSYVGWNGSFLKVLITTFVTSQTPSCCFDFFSVNDPPCSALQAPHSIPARIERSKCDNRLHWAFLRIGKVFQNQALVISFQQNYSSTRKRRVW